MTNYAAPACGPITEVEHLRIELARARRDARWEQRNAELYRQLAAGREDERAAHRDEVQLLEQQIADLTRHRKWESEIDQIRCMLTQVHQWLSDPRPQWQDAVAARQVLEDSGMLPRRLRRAS